MAYVFLSIAFYACITVSSSPVCLRNIPGGWPGENKNDPEPRNRNDDNEKIFKTAKEFCEEFGVKCVEGDEKYANYLEGGNVIELGHTDLNWFCDCSEKEGGFEKWAGVHGQCIFQCKVNGKEQCDEGSVCRCPDGEDQFGRCEPDDFDTPTAVNCEDIKAEEGDLNDEYCVESNYKCKYCPDKKKCVVDGNSNKTTTALGFVVLVIYHFA